MSRYRITAEFFRRCTRYPNPSVGAIVNIRGKGYLVITAYDPDQRVYEADPIDFRTENMK